MTMTFHMDWAMCGGEELPADFDPEDFCGVLQGKLPEVQILAVTNPHERAVNRDPSLVTDTVFNDAPGEYCHR